LADGGLQVRSARGGDLPCLVDIDALAYRRDRREARVAGLMPAGAAGDCLVVLAGGEVRGFLAYQQVVDRATLLDVVVHPDYHGQGLGTALLGAAIDQLVACGVQRCELEVRASNAAAIALYSALGFGRDGERPGYYPGEDAREDAMLMSLELEGTADERTGN
jgi:ribosomal-protein-alanine N-acetyltransferase